MENTDKKFFITLFGVMAGMVFLALAIWMVAHIFGGTERQISQVQLDRNQDRINPIGQVNVGGQPAKAAKTATEVVAETVKSAASGDQVYAMACQACHAGGIADAPILGDKSIWAIRMATGVDALYNSALQGKGAMPAKGGNASLSDAEVKAAVDYILKSSR